MGKSKPRNRAKHRTNPTAKEVKPPTDPELAALRQKRILPVIKDLQSPEQKTRSAAARAITNLIEDTKTRKLLLREQIVKILLQQTLTDSSLETRTDGWGILQNLVLEEERDFCVHLYRQDILTAIEGASKSVSGKRSRLHEHSSLLEVDRSNPRVPRCTLHKTLEATATSCLDLHQFNCQPDFLSFGSTG